MNFWRVFALNHSHLIKVNSQIVVVRILKISMSYMMTVLIAFHINKLAKNNQISLHKYNLKTHQQINILINQEYWQIPSKDLFEIFVLTNMLL